MKITIQRTMTMKEPDAKITKEETEALEQEMDETYGPRFSIYNLRP
jgi:hypothetical protein